MKKKLNIIQLAVSSIILILLFVPIMFENGKYNIVSYGMAKSEYFTDCSFVEIIEDASVMRMSTAIILVGCLFIFLIIMSIAGCIVSLISSDTSTVSKFFNRRITMILTCIMPLLLIVFMVLIEIAPIGVGGEWFYKFYYSATPLVGFWLVVILSIAVVIIDVYKRSSKVANAPVAIKTNVVQANSNADELKKYKDLLDSGVITQEEFEAKKKQLLGL